MPLLLELATIIHEFLPFIPIFGYREYRPKIYLDAYVTLVGSLEKLREF
jgi:hypothetical protein